MSPHTRKTLNFVDLKSYDFFKDLMIHTYVFFKYFL